MNFGPFRADRDPTEITEVEVESVILKEIIFRLPARLTYTELCLWLGDEGVSPCMVEEGIERLRRSNLVRVSDEVVEPTFQAVRAAEIFAGLRQGMRTDDHP
jgi:hypothetical protein